MNYRNIEKEFEEFMEGYVRHAGEWHNNYCHFVYDDDGVCNCELAKNKKKIKVFYKAKINQILDECIGEERKIKQYHTTNEVLKHMGSVGYNLKVKELKEYKKKFNK